MRSNIKAADEILGIKYKVLDKGYVQLVDYCGGDDMIESFARISYGKGTIKSSDTRNLIRYLISHRHSTPIESTELSFGLALPIHVARQLVRHRTFSPINEYSARYSEVPEVCYENYELNIQSKNNKQGRAEDKIDDTNDFQSQINNIHEQSFTLYQDMLKDGVAKELARMHLPLNSYTYWFCKMDLSNLFKFLSLRLDKHAQWEIRQYAQIIACMTKLVAPIAFEAFYDYHFMGTHFSRLELSLLNYQMQLKNSQNPAINDRDLIAAKATELGMSKREIEEFASKLEVKPEQDFSLDKYELYSPNIEV